MALQKLLTAGFSEGDKIMYEQKLGYEFREKVLLNSSTINKSFSKVKKNIHDLASLREDFFKNLLEVHQAIDPLFHWCLEN